MVWGGEGRGEKRRAWEWKEKNAEQGRREGRGERRGNVRRMGNEKRREEEKGGKEGERKVRE